MSEKRVLAIGAHPDDIEFMMAGTLLQLKAAGYAVHMFNVANGSCGSMVENGERTAAIRLQEAQNAAQMLGAQYHPPIVDDLEVFYTKPLLQRVAAVIRVVQPDILLTHPPEDYMEDHMTTCRLAVSAAFARGMRNFVTHPEVESITTPLTVYHALPYGLNDALRRPIIPDTYVDITPVLSQKRQALACHESQKSWLDDSQGLDSYLQTMEDMSREVGEWSQQFTFAEGWRRHSHLGFCEPKDDPLADALAAYCRVDTA